MSTHPDKLKISELAAAIAKELHPVAAGLAEHAFAHDLRSDCERRIERTAAIIARHLAPVVEELDGFRRLVPQIEDHSRAQLGRVVRLASTNIEQHSELAALRTERDQLRAEVERLKKEWGVIKNQADAWMQVSSIFYGKVGMTFPESIIQEVTALRARLAVAEEVAGALEFIMAGYEGHYDSKPDTNCYNNATAALAKWDAAKEGKK